MSGADLFAVAPFGVVGVIQPPVLLIVGTAFFLALLVVASCVDSHYERRCPVCRRTKALLKTGKKTKRREEWRCMHCGHTSWKAKPPVHIPFVGG